MKIILLKEHSVLTKELSPTILYNISHSNSINKKKNRLQIKSKNVLHLRTKHIISYLVAQCKGVAKSSPPTASTTAPLLM